MRGKRIVSANATRHGMTCKTFIFLDDEDSRVFWAAVDRMARERGVTTQEERTAIETAVYSQWTKVRANNALVSSINEARAEIRDDFADGSVKAVREWISRLAAEPDVAVEELSKSTRGCEFLLRQFQLLDEWLERHPSLEVSQRGYALRVGGHRPNELFSDKFVSDFNKAYFGGLSGAGAFTAEECGNALQFDRPDGMSYTELVRRLGIFAEDLPTVEEGHRRLKQYVANQIQRLTERHELVGYREERRLRAALETAQSPTDPQAVTWSRYIATSDRTYNSSMRLLMALQKDRREHGDEYGTAVGECVSEPASVPPVQDDVPAAIVVVSPVVDSPAEGASPAGPIEIQNKAVVPQVVGRPGDYNPISPAPVVEPAAPAPAATSLDPGLAVIEKYMKEFDDELRPYDHLE